MLCNDRPFICSILEKIEHPSFLKKVTGPSIFEKPLSEKAPGSKNFFPKFFFFYFPITVSVIDLTFKF